MQKLSKQAIKYFKQQTIFVSVIFGIILPIFGSEISWHAIHDFSPQVVRSVTLSFREGGKLSIKVPTQLLGEWIDCKGDQSLCQELLKKTISLNILLSKKFVFSQWVVKKRLKYFFPVVKIKWEGIPQISIKVLRNILTQTLIRPILSKKLCPNLSKKIKCMLSKVKILNQHYLWAGGTYRYQMKPWKVEETSYYNKKDRKRVFVNYQHTESNHRGIASVFIQLVQLRKVAVARRFLKANQKISAKDIKMIWGQVRTYKQTMFTEQTLGFYQTRKFIEKEEHLTFRNLKKIHTISRGDYAWLTIQRGRLFVRQRIQAKQSGYKGERILVRTVNKKHSLMATVLDQNTLLVE